MNRKILAILLCIIFLALAGGVFVTGLAVGTMAGDGCPPGADFGIAPLWLFIAWPLILLAGALIPPWLVLRGKRAGWVLLAIALGAAAAAAGFWVWIVIVERVCYAGG